MQQAIKETLYALTVLGICLTTLGLLGVVLVHTWDSVATLSLGIIVFGIRHAIKKWNVQHAVH